MPICSMYGIFTNMCPKNHPNVVKYTIHGFYGYVKDEYTSITQPFQGTARCAGEFLTRGLVPGQSVAGLGLMFRSNSRDKQDSEVCFLFKNAIMSGWWFGTFFIFPYIGNNHPNWLIFFRGVQTTNQVFIFQKKNINGWVSEYIAPFNEPVRVFSDSGVNISWRWDLWP